MALAPALLAGPAQLQRTQGAFSFRGGGPHGYPPSTMRANGGGNNNRSGEPPIREVVGAGAVGVLAGHIVFQSLLISVGLGATVMGFAATSPDEAGQIARSSGRVAVAVFDRSVMFNRRFQITGKAVEGARAAGWKLREFNDEHAVVHRATEGVKQAWLGFKQYDETHGLTVRAGNALASGLDTLTEILTPPPANTRRKRRNSSSNKSSNTNNTANNYRSISSRAQRRGDNSSSAKSVAAGDGENAGGWSRSWWRDGLLKREAGGGGLGPAGGEGNKHGVVWHQGVGDMVREGWRGAETGRRKKHKRSQTGREEEGLGADCWRILWGDDE